MRSTWSASAGRLLVVRELLLGPKRFTDLREGLPRASTNILSERLRELEQRSVVQRRRTAAAGGLDRLRADRVGQWSWSRS